MATFSFDDLLAHKNNQKMLPLLTSTITRQTEGIAEDIEIVAGEDLQLTVVHNSDK